MTKTTPTGSAKNASVDKDVAVLEVPQADPAPNKPEPTVTMTHAELDAKIAQAMGRWAQNNPASMRPNRDAVSDKPDVVLDIPMTGRLEDLARPDLVIEKGADALFNGDWLREIAFQEEVITVTLHESTNPNDQAMVMVSVNGRSQWFLRGEPTPCRRHYAEKLGRTRREDVQVKVARDGDGNPVNRTVRKNALEFPFNVTDDPNPLGKAWLAKLMREG